MKKTFILLILCIIFVSGCSKEGKARQQSSVSYEEGIYKDKDLDNLEHEVTDICVPNKETATAIANSILLNFQSKGKFKGYTIQSIFYDTKDEIWIISCWENKKEYVGADFNIALRKNNGQVIKMWVGE